MTLPNYLLTGGGVVATRRRSVHYVAVGDDRAWHDRIQSPHPQRQIRNRSPTHFPAVCFHQEPEKRPSDYRQAIDALPYGKRLPGAVYLIDPGDSSNLPSLPREADLIKIHLHSRKLTFHYYRDFDKAPLPELLTRIKIDLKRLFVTIIDHTNGAEHQLLFFKERFLAKDHPERARMDRFSAKHFGLVFSVFSGRSCSAQAQFIGLGGHRHAATS